MSNFFKKSLTFGLIPLVLGYILYSLTAAYGLLGYLVGLTIVYTAASYAASFYTTGMPFSSREKLKKSLK